jgi:hypothetical protein
MSVGQGQEPLSYETSVEERSDGAFEVIVTTVGPDGARRMQVGVHPNRRKAELAASVINRSAHRYVNAGNPGTDAPTFANPDL